MENKSNFEQIINSCKNINKVEPGPFLFEKIKEQIKARNLTQQNLNDSKSSLIWLWAFGITLIITINVFIISKTASNSLNNISNDSNNLKYQQFNYNY
jgi:hypothetical protein